MNSKQWKISAFRKRSLWLPWIRKVEVSINLCRIRHDSLGHTVFEINSRAHWSCFGGRLVSNWQVLPSQSSFTQQKQRIWSRTDRKSLYEGIMVLGKNSQRSFKWRRRGEYHSHWHRRHWRFRLGSKSRYKNIHSGNSRIELLHLQLNRIHRRERYSESKLSRQSN